MHPRIGSYGPLFINTNTTKIMNLDKDFLRDNDLGLLLLRLTVGGLMLFHGVHKLVYGVSAIEGMLAGLGLPGFIAYLSLAAELIASVLIVLGAWTRVAAVVMVGNMAVAVLMAHLPVIFSVDPMTWRLGHRTADAVPSWCGGALLHGWRTVCADERTCNRLRQKYPSAEEHLDIFFALYCL